jgi:hypothetical protein
LCRHRLHNLAVGEEEGPHLEEVSAAESTAKAGGQVGGEAIEQGRSIVGARLPVLFLLNDSATDGPVGRRDQRVHRPRRRASRRLDEPHDVREHEHGVVASLGSRHGGLFTRHGHIRVTATTLHCSVPKS